MSPAQRRKHNLTHLPMHPGCAICRATRSPNAVHVMSHESERVIPLLVGHYCFLRRIDETLLQTCLVMRLYPYKCFMACAVPKKGFDELVIRRLVIFLTDMGAKGLGA